MIPFLRTDHADLQVSVGSAEVLFIYFRQKYFKSVSLLFDIWVRVETHLAALEFSQESVGIPAGLLKDVKKVRGPVEQILK